jgi:hypothetical protein
LALSHSELNELESGKLVSLEDRSLGEIGAVFILASALAAANSGKKTITFRDLPQAATDSGCCSGIPIYCWNSESSGKIYLCLTIVDGKPAIRTCYHS